MVLNSRLTLVVQRIATEFKTLRSNDLGGLKFRKMSVVAYAALPVKDPNTIYFVNGLVYFTGS